MIIALRYEQLLQDTLQVCESFDLYFNLLLQSYESMFNKFEGGVSADSSPDRLFLYDLKFSLEKVKNLYSYSYLYKIPRYNKYTEIIHDLIDYIDKYL